MTNSHRELLRDDVEGDSDTDVAHVARLDASGRATSPWKDAVDRERSRALAATSAPDMAGPSFETRAAALLDARGPTLITASQRYSSTASHYCHGGAWLSGSTAPEVVPLDGCAVEPLVHAASRGERNAIWAYGRDYVAHNAYMNRANMSDTQVVEPAPAPAAVLIVRERTEKWRRIAVSKAKAGGAVAIGPDAVALVGRERKDARAPRPSAARDTIALVVVPWTRGAIARYDLDDGDVGEPTVTYVGDDVLVVYARRQAPTDPYRMHAARISRAGDVSKLGAFGPDHAIAPAVTSAGNALALAFTEDTKPSRVRFACGAADVTALATGSETISDPSQRARDPELALAPDGATGAIAFHTFTAKGSSVRTTAFSCRP